MSDPRSDPIIRKGSLLLSALVLTPDSALEAFRTRRAADPELDLELLEKARAILDAVGFAVCSRERGNWQRIEQAWAILRKIAPPPEEQADASQRPGKPKEEATAVPPAPEPAPATTAAPALAAAPPANPPAITKTKAATESPWAGPTSPTPPTPAVPAPPQNGSPPAPAVAPAQEQAGSVDETAAVDIRMLSLGDGLPFEAGSGQAPPPVGDELPPATGSVDETAAITKLELGPALPFAGEPVPIPATGTPELTMEQYASLRAERELAEPAALAALDRRYGLTDADAARVLDEIWDQRLTANAKERQRFDDLLAHFAEWLARR